MVIEWNRDDAGWLRNILSQPSGRKLVDAMRDMLPRVKALTKESAWIQAVEKQGAEDMINKFLSLAELPSSTAGDITGYVDLTKEGD